MKIPNNNRKKWKNRRKKTGQEMTYVIKQNGVPKCSGPRWQRFQTRCFCKQLQAGGCKIYVDRKLWKEAKEKEKGG